MFLRGSVLESGMFNCNMLQAYVSHKTNNFIAATTTTQIGPERSIHLALLFQAFDTVNVKWLYFDSGFENYSNQTGENVDMIKQMSLIGYEWTPR